MDISEIGARSIRESLVSEEGHATAPTTVADHWLALTGGDTSTVTYCSMQQGDGRTQWTVLGVLNESLLLLEASAEDESWTRDRGPHVSGKITRAEVVPIDRISRLALRHAEDLLAGAGASWRMASHWTLDIDGETFAIPSGSPFGTGWLERVDMFVSAVRDARFGKS